MRIGTVDRLRRYPVKSMLGEELGEAAVSERGLHGDRVLGLLDAESGRVASAKNPRLWAGMLGFTAVLDVGGVVITGPDGRVVRETELSGLLGRKVSLVGERPAGATVERAVPEEVLARGTSAEVAVTENEIGRAAPAGTFFDFAPLHLLTTSTLDAVAAGAERYRPNLVIRTEGEGYVENEWVGRELRIGPDLRLRVLVPTPRCAVPTLPHGELPRSTGALKVLAAQNRLVPLEGMAALPCAGVYAQVVEPGRVRVGTRSLSADDCGGGVRRRHGAVSTPRDRDTVGGRLSADGGQTPGTASFALVCQLVTTGLSTLMEPTGMLTGFGSVWPMATMTSLNSTAWLSLVLLGLIPA